MVIKTPKPRGNTKALPGESRCLPAFVAINFLQPVIGKISNSLMSDF